MQRCFGSASQHQGHREEVEKVPTPHMFPEVPSGMSPVVLNTNSVVAMKVDKPSSY